MQKLSLIFTCIVLSITQLFSQTATIDLTSEKQLIKGFGGINHPVWYKNLNTAERDLCFGNDEGQLGLTVLRIWISDNKDQWALDVETAKRAIELGAVVFATPWNPPSSMTWDDNGKKRINTSKFAEYAAHLNEFVTYMKNNGVDLYAISTQNEPDYAHDWTEWTPEESVDFIKGYADQIDCRIITPESFQYRKNVYDPILNDTDALSKVDIFGTHLYGTAVSDFDYPLFEQKGAGKELWMTEVYTDSKYDANIWDNSVIGEKHHALYAAEHIHHAMVAGNFQTYVWWPIRRHYALVHDGTNATNSFSGVSPATAGTATKRGYCVAQFSKFIRPGFTRVDATASPTSNVFISAYKKDGNVVIVAVNKNTSAQSISFSVPGTQVTSWEQYTTSSSKNVAKGSTIIGGASFQVTLEAASVTTFVGNADDGMPTVEITDPANNDIFIEGDIVSIDATATDEDGTISNIFYYINDELIQEEWVAPYAFDWTAESAGTYTIKAVATDNDGNKAEDVITIKVNVPQSPYGGTAHLIPGIIQAEEYDLGGNGFAYFDDSEGSETGQTYRADEDVDISECTDEGEGYCLAYVTAGEWLEYTVDVDKSGTYDINLRVANNGDPKTVSLSMDGTDIATDISIPNTEGWQAWQTVTINDVDLKAGEQILRFTMGVDDYVNLNYISFEAVQVEETVIKLTKGWNLIGCPLDGSTSIETALSSIWDNVEIVKDFDGFYEQSNVPLNSLTELNWGRGYFVKVSEDCELTW